MVSTYQCNGTDPLQQWAVEILNMSQPLGLLCSPDATFINSFSCSGTPTARLQRTYSDYSRSGVASLICGPSGYTIVIASSGGTLTCSTGDGTPPTPCQSSSYTWWVNGIGWACAANTTGNDVVVLYDRQPGPGLFPSNYSTSFILDSPFDGSALTMSGSSTTDVTYACLSSGEDQGMSERAAD